MRFGTYHFLQAPPGRGMSQVLADEVDQMVLAEELGYDSVWLTEHHYADYGLSSAPSVLAAAVAARTSRVRIGFAVYVLPFHHPLRLAEETATLDVLSNGRLTVGLGRGNRPLEFAGHLVRQEESRGRLEEGLEVLRQAWTQERVTFHGAYWHFDGIPVYPKPLAQPHPPLAFAVTSQDSLRWCGANGYAILSSGLSTPLPVSLQARATYEEALRTAGHSAAGIAGLLSRWTLSKHVYVAPTDAEAQAQAEPAERWYQDSFARSLEAAGIVGLDEAVYRQAEQSIARVRGLRWEDLLQSALLVGSPDSVAAKVDALQQAGVGELMCWTSFGGLDPALVRRSMRLFAQEVMPAFHG